METKHKYVRIGKCSFIFFPITIDHSTFKHLNPISAGFCYLDSPTKRVHCFGESYSLGKSPHPDDTRLATIQVYGLQ